MAHSHSKLPLTSLVSAHKFGFKPTMALGIISVAKRFLKSHALELKGQNSTPTPYFYGCFLLAFVAFQPVVKQKSKWFNEWGISPIIRWILFRQYPGIWIPLVYTIANALFRPCTCGKTSNKNCPDFWIQLFQPTIEGAFFTLIDDSRISMQNPSWKVCDKADR